MIEEFFDSDEFKTGKPGVNRYIVYKIVLSSGRDDQSLVGMPYGSIDPH